MPARGALRDEERHFFALLAEIIFTNPFGDERAELERLVSAEKLTEVHSHGEHHFTALVPVVDERFERLHHRGLKTLSDITSEHRRVVEFAYLFQAYHRYVEHFDVLIQAQIDEAGTRTPIGFAKEAIGHLVSRGFAPPMAAHYFGLFYQLRRAYYFIARSLVGDSVSMRQLREALWNNVFTYDARIYEEFLWPRMEDFSTLLLGETGTGKGSAAAAIGRSGYIPFDLEQGRFTHSVTEVFISTNLSQFPESLIESELFGHRKGAFTGAVDDHEGLFARCKEQGALFLDEIGDAGPDIQLKVLQVLQERTFRPVGSHQQLRFSGRVIAATNRSIAELRKLGRFRDDFFYRLCSDVIRVPPLRDRISESPSELPLLVELLIERMVGEKRTRLTNLVLDTLSRDLPKSYRWPGNVRELEQAARRILLTRSYLGDQDMQADSAADLATALQEGRLPARDLLTRYCKLLYERFGTYEEVARRAQLDRRTVKKYLRQASKDLSLDA